MRDLTDPRAMYLKAALFGLIGVSSAVLLFAEAPSVRTTALIALTVWSFCRLYYFAFYVLERYIDPTYRFSGLCSALSFVARRTRNGQS